MGLYLGNQQEQVDAEGNMDVDEPDGIGASSTGVPESDSGLKPDVMPAPEPPAPSVQLPSPRGPRERHLDPGSSLDKRREPPQVPQVNRTQYDEMTWDQLHYV